jgi:hypothetical protein
MGGRAVIILLPFAPRANQVSKETASPDFVGAGRHIQKGLDLRQTGAQYFAA